MSALATRPLHRSPWLFVCIALLGIALGLSFSTAQRLTFDKVYAVLSPLGFGATCIDALLRERSYARWLVPVSLLLHVAGITIHPHAPALSAFGIAAGVVTIIATFRKRKGWAIGGVVLCFAAISASLVLGDDEARSAVPTAVGSAAARFL